MESKYPIQFFYDKNNNEVIITFHQTKFAAKDLGIFSNLFNQFFKARRSFVFDLSSLEWIAHEELVYLSGLFDQLYSSNIPFKIQLKRDKPTERQIKTIVFLWKRWQIFSFIEKEKLLNEIGYFFDLTNSSENIDFLCNFFDKEEDKILEVIDEFNKKIKVEAYEIKKYFDINYGYVSNIIELLSDDDEEDNEEEKSYGYYHKIAPFTKLNIPKGILNEKLIKSNIDNVYQLDERTNTLLEKHSSHTPFLNRTLSSIITKELYENSIEHAFQNKKVKHPSCYLSVTLRNKIDEEKHEKYDIENIKKSNFNSEEIPNAINFFKTDSSFKNQSLIQFTYLDFGDGIPNSLRDIYNRKFNLIEANDSEILSYAFDYSSSRHPLSQKYIERNFIPRGLFDVTSIVKRYKGLIIVRSNYGRILYDFSIDEEINNCLILFEKERTYNFNGTIITIYIPENQFGIETKKIKPQYLKEAVNKTPFYLNILDIQKQAAKRILLTSYDNNEYKARLYNETLDRIADYLDSRQNKNCCVFIDFKGCFIESRLVKKVLFFLASDYRINEKTNVVITNLDNRDLLIQVQLDILGSDKNTFNFIFHPLPCILRLKNKFEIIWLGITNKKSENHFNQILISEFHDRRLSDFDNTQEILDTGLFRLDDYGNLKSIIGTIDEQNINQLIEKSTLQDEKSIFLCAGNYYQFEYIALLEYLYDIDYSDYIASLLYDEVVQKEKDFFNDVTHIFAITLSSQLIANSFYNADKSQHSKKESQLLKSTRLIRLSNYHSYHLEAEFIQNIKEGDKIVLICDVISTGYLINSLKEKLGQMSVTLKGVISILDTRVTVSFSKIKSYFEESISTFTLRKHPIQKYTSNCILNFVDKEIVRINPATNTPISMEENKSEIEETVLYKDEDFLSLIENPERYIQIGFFRYNKLFHPYFFETHELFKSHNGPYILNKLLKRIFEIRDIEINYIFYPIFSGAELFNSQEYQDKVFKNYSAEFIPLARFDTAQGWRFAFPPKILNTKTYNSNILVLDDGSCTGSTLIQMLDEISFLDVKSINLLSIIGRTSDFLREFFSRIKQLKVKYLNDSLTHLLNINARENNDNRIPLNIFFGSHWHIPTYPLSSDFPYFEEEKRLEYYYNLDNLPDFLRDYVNRRIAKIQLSPAIANKPQSNLGYLPVNNSGQIPKVDLLLARNHLGKINGYRFYKDYFDEFNNYYRKFFLDNKNEELYKRTELYLACLLHEPYLIRTVQDFIPDLYNSLLDFTADIITTGNNVEGFYNYESLFYKWKRASILSIYLNLRKDKLKETITSTNLEKILLFASQDEKDASIIIFFMFILNYMPISKNELHKQEDGVYCLNQLFSFSYNSHSEQIKPSILSKLKQYISLLNTIPYLDKELVNKRVCLLKLNQFFIHESSNENHDSIEKRLGVIKIQCKAIPYERDLFKQNEILQKIKDSWRIILPRLEKLIRYSKRVIGFYQVYKEGIIYNDIFNSQNGLIKIVKEINTFIEDDMIIHNSKTIFNYSKDILLPNFFTKEAFIYKLFLEFNTRKIDDVWNDTIGRRITNTQFRETNIQLVEVNKLSIQFPIQFFIDVFLQEIRVNFRYADENHPIIYNWHLEKNLLFLNIENKIGPNGKKGGKNGQEVIKLLSSFFDFKIIEFREEETIFVQSYSFKIE